MNDLRLAVRMLFKNPGFTLVAVTVLALGIGANTAMFSLVNTLVLRPLAVQQPEELTGCYSRDKNGSYRSFSYANYRDLRDRNTAFSSLMAFNVIIAGVNQADLTRRVFSGVISANYFSTLGVKLVRGREFTLAEEQPGSTIPVVIVGYKYWRETGKDPDLVGKAIKINGRSYTVVGITPENFTGTSALLAPELWLPLGVYEWVANDFMNQQKRQLSDRSHHCLHLVGRLKPGLDIAAAEPQMKTLMEQLAKAFPTENKDQSLVLARMPRINISTNPNPNTELPMLSVFLMSMSGIVLVIACLNLANMLLARSATRSREFAIRLALGGGRTRIMRQLLTEGLLLSILGGLAGLWLAYVGLKFLLVALAPSLSFLNFVVPTTPDIRVLAATGAFCVLSTLIFAFGPAWKLSRLDVISDLKEHMGETAHSGFGGKFLAPRNLLVMGQIALSLALLTGAGLFVRGAHKATQANPGFKLQNSVLVELDMSLAGYNEARGRELYARMLEQLRALPGVASASMANIVPFGIFSDGRGVLKAGAPTPGAGTDAAEKQEKPINANLNIIGAEYFKTIGLPLLRGRDFNRTEAGSTTGVRIAIVDEPMAQALWPGEDPVGHRIQFIEKGADGQPEVMEIVGMVPGVRDELFDRTSRPHVYIPFGKDYRAAMNLHIKLAQADPGAESAMVKTVGDQLRKLDAQMPILSIKTLQSHHTNGLMMGLLRTGTTLFTLFGALAAFLTVVGVYGVKAYVVARRTREIGIRMALGATTQKVIWLILREGMTLTLAGVTIGLLLAWAAGRLISNMLYEVSATDPLIFSLVPLCLALAALAACYVPARRATQVPPMQALRYE